MKEIYSTLKDNDKEYKLVFNLNVVESIQDEYKTLDNWSSLTDGEAGEVNVKALVFGITEMINEAIDIDNDENGKNEPFMTHKQVSRLLTRIGLDKAVSTMNKTVIDSTKDPSEDSKNE